MSWSNHRIVKAKKIAQWGAYTPPGKQRDEISDADSMKRLVDGIDATIMAQLVGNPGEYTHLVQVDFPGPPLPSVKGGVSRSILRSDYYFAEVAFVIRRENVKTCP